MNHNKQKDRPAYRLGYNISYSIYFKTNQPTSIIGECLDALYDVTIAYPDKKPLTEHDIAQGMFPSEIHFHIKRLVTRKKYVGIILYIICSNFDQ